MAIGAALGGAMGSGIAGQAGKSASSAGMAKGNTDKGVTEKKKKPEGLMGFLGIEGVDSAPSQFGAGGTANQGAGAPADRPEPVATPLPVIPDSAPLEPAPDQDLSPLADAPKRKPLRSSLGSFPAAAGITGYAGVFIP